MKITVRLVSALLAALLTVSLASCGGKESPASDASSAATDTVSSGDSTTTAVSQNDASGSTDTTAEGNVLKPQPTKDGAGTAAKTTKKTTTYTGSKETLPSSYELTSPQEKKFASLKGKTVNIGTSSSNVETDNENTKTFRTLFQKKYGVKLNFVVMKSGVDGQNQIGQMVAAGNPPDAYGYSEVTFLRYIYANVAQPMDKYLAKDDPLYRDVDLSDTTLNGKIYGIPGTWGIKGYMCVFNKTLFKEQKVKNPTELYLEGNWNYKTFLETAKKMTLYREDGKTVKTYGVGTWDYALLMYANGGKGLVEDGKGGLKATIDQPAEMGGLQLLYDLVSAGAFYTGDSYSGFGRRMIAMHLEQPWNAVGAYDYFNNMEDDIGIAPMPMANDGKYYFPKSSGGTFIPRNAKNPLGGVAYAYELAKFDNNRFFTSTNDYDVMQRRQCITDADLKIYQEYRKKAVPLMSYMEALSGWWDTGYRAKFWNTIVVDKKKPAEAVASMKSVLESCIKRTTG